MIYLFPEVKNQVYFLPNLNGVIFLIDPMMEGFSRIEKNGNELIPGFSYQDKNA